MQKILESAKCLRENRINHSDIYCKIYIMLAVSMELERENDNRPKSKPPKPPRRSSSQPKVKTPKSPVKFVLNRQQRSPRSSSCPPGPDYDAGCRKKRVSKIMTVMNSSQEKSPAKKMDVVPKRSKRKRKRAEAENLLEKWNGPDPKRKRLNEAANLITMLSGGDARQNAVVNELLQERQMTNDFANILCIK